MRRFACLLAVAVPLGVWAGAKDKPPQAKPEQGVNWAGQVIKATGSGAPDMRAQNPAQARLGAERAAQLDAFRNLLAQAKGIEISAGKTVGDALAKDEVRGKVEGVLRGFKITAKRYFSDSGVEIDVEVPLAALTSALVAVDEKGALALKSDGEKKNTGLVVDARGLELTPALAPRLVDAAGKTLYGAQALSAEARQTAGVAAYLESLDAAKKDQRVGERPLVVKAASAQGSDLVLSAEDAKKLAESNNSYLAEGRVIIVTR